MEFLASILNLRIDLKYLGHLHYTINAIFPTSCQAVFGLNRPVLALGQKYGSLCQQSWRSKEANPVSLDFLEAPKAAKLFRSNSVDCVGILRVHTNILADGGSRGL